MSSTLYACYRPPADPHAFDQHYKEVHSPIALKLPGLRSFTGTTPSAGPDGSPAPYYFIAALTFDDDASLASALSGPEGKAAVDDLANFAGAGVDLMTGPTVAYS
ncbi:EthD family reductase [Allobranchiibius sp. CTAmp26]|uniref:EthD family reductase n=1 Tax=Allobranchiibius sp. CTAmp26 TaxID=2815214 RepID=UPI001AA16D98|nr:EthD family reductase [Allobranchiibius sp. CTAmp26]MBO1755726.1 EthD family reductase [Allobranchiibius sp. CTAmp26]